MRSGGLEMPKLSSSNRWVLYLACAALLIYVYFEVRHLLAAMVGISLPELPMPALAYVRTAALSVFVFLHFAYLRGWKFSSAFFMIVSCWAWLGEQVSIMTGFPFGRYTYSPMLGLQLGYVPLIIPPDYVALFVYPTFLMTMLILEGKIMGKVKSFGRILFLGLFTSLLVDGWDAVVDPVDATQHGQWIWLHHSNYYGIPYSNYAGYIFQITIMVVLYLYFFESKSEAKPLGPVNFWITALPLINFAISWLDYSVGGPGGLIFIGLFSIFVPVIIAMDRLRKIFAGHPMIELEK
jgi:putative membrane protein